MTAIATARVRGKADQPVVLSASRDKTLIVWKLNEVTPTQDYKSEYGKPFRRLKGHSHFVEDVAISSDGMFALSGSWDNTMRLWNLDSGETRNQFVGHKNDVLSVAFSPKNSHIISGSRDKTINLWNTIGQLKYTMTDNGHTGWVSCVRFSPDERKQTFVSAGWDKVVKVWSLNPLKVEKNLIGHTAYINTVTVSPDGSLCASGGKDGVANLWDLKDGKLLSSFDAKDVIHALCFSPIHFWICAATASSIKIWKIQESGKLIIETLTPEAFSEKEQGKKAVPVQCISLAWGPRGNVLFAGFTDNTIRVWNVEQIA